MFRVRLRTFLIATTALGVAGGLYFGNRWQPRSHGGGFPQETAHGIRYDVNVLTESAAFRNDRFLSAVVVPLWIKAPGVLHAGARQPPQRDDDLEMFPNGVFFRGKLIAGYGTSRVVISLTKYDARVIPLTEDDIAKLDKLRGRAIVESRVWKEKVEPEIERLVVPRLSEHRRAWLANQGLLPK